MDARLEKLRQRKIRKLKEQGLAADDDDVETPVSEEVSKDTNIEHEEPTSPTKDESGISASDIEERIKNERARIEKSHLNKWEKSKIGKNGEWHKVIVQLLYINLEVTQIELSWRSLKLHNSS